LKNSESKNPSPETQNTQKDFSKWQQNTKNVKQSRQCTMSSALEQKPSELLKFSPLEDNYDVCAHAKCRQRRRRRRVM
jgi:hypothetical protein